MVWGWWLRWKRNLCDGGSVILVTAEALLGNGGALL